jgi:hypothetical protein
MMEDALKLEEETKDAESLPKGLPWFVFPSSQPLIEHVTEKIQREKEGTFIEETPEEKAEFKWKWFENLDEFYRSMGVVPPQMGKQKENVETQG